MSESQSRYGIMEELNNRKINEKEKLANIERETDNVIYNGEKEISQVENEVKEREKNYEQKHKDKIREMTLKLGLFKSDVKRQIDELEGSIKEENNTYKSIFIDWKKERVDSVAKQKEILCNYQKIQTKKISDKKSVIEEIEKGIDSLKEISKEHKTE